MAAKEKHISIAVANRIVFMGPLEYVRSLQRRREQTQIYWKIYASYSQRIKKKTMASACQPGPIK